MMYYAKKSASKCEWIQIELDKTAQEENLKVVLNKIASDCVITFTDDSALGISEPKGSGAAIYYQGIG